jgi:hypothetical protein
MGVIRLGGDPLPAEVDVHCIACGSGLYLLPDSYPLVFHCEQGHFLTIQDLLDEFLPLGRTPKTPDLEFWERGARMLHQLAARALEGGHALNAADFKDTAGRVDRWVAQLRLLLPRTAPGAGAPADGDSEHRNRAPEVL